MIHNLTSILKKVVKKKYNKIFFKTKNFNFKMIKKLLNMIKIVR